MATLTTPQSPRALILSTLLHALVVIGVLLFAWWSKRQVDQTPQIFELVAGPGEDYQATEAPAAVPAPAIKLDLPPPPVVTPAPQPTPKVVEPTPPPKKETPPPTPKKETPPPTPKIEKAPPVPKVEKAPEPAPKKMTLEDFRKAHGAPKTPQAKAPAPVTPKKIDVAGVAGAVSSTSSSSAGASGTATKTDDDLMGRYYALIRQRIRNALIAAGVTDNRSAQVRFQISGQGVISSPVIVGASGSSEFDAAVLQAFRTIAPLGPPPVGGAQTLSVTVNLHERT
jgi:colicin import membrane protein